MSEKAHEIHGGSSVYQWSNCQGWASLVTQMPDEPSGVAALRGTALHTGVLEIKTHQEIQNRLSGSPVTLDYSDIDNWPEEGPQLAEEFWNTVWKEVLEEFVTGKTIYIEKKLMLFPDMSCGGTADFIVLYYNDKGKLVAWLGDCKFGRIRVSPDSEQLKFYLVALNKLVKEQGKEIEEFWSFVYQPEHEDPFTKHKFTKSDIEKAEAKYLKAILESKKEKPKFKVGDWCRWCKAQARCKTYGDNLDKEMELSVIRTENKIEFAPVETMPDEILAKIYLFQSKVKEYFSKIDKEIVYRFMAGNPVPGLKIVEGKSNRKWEDESKVVLTLESHSLEPYQPAKLKGLGEVEKELKIKGKKPAEAKAIIDALCIKPEGKPKITTADDPRQPFSFKNAADLLDGLDAEGGE